MDVDTVLQSVQERDKWLTRLELLERSLKEVRDQRQKVQKRLRRIRRDLSKLTDYTEAVLEQSNAAGRLHPVHAPHESHLTPR